MKLFKREKKEQKLCPNCAKPLADGSAFCDSCGLRVTPPPACAKCKLPLAPDTNFCEACGTPVGTSPESLPEVTTASALKKKNGRKTKKKAIKKDEFVHPDMLVPEESEPEHQISDETPVNETDAASPNTGPLMTRTPAAGFFPALPRSSKMFLAIVCIGFLCLIVAGTVLTGLLHLPVLPGMKDGTIQSGPLPVKLNPEMAALPEGTEATPDPPSFVPGPTQVPPQSYQIWLQEERSPITSIVTVIYNGGKGQRAVREIAVRLTRSDGQVLTQTFRPLTVGEGASLQGTRFTDRLQVNVTYNNGDIYTVVDRIFAYKQRN